MYYIIKFRYISMCILYFSRLFPFHTPIFNKNYSKSCPQELWIISAVLLLRNQAKIENCLLINQFYWKKISNAVIKKRTVNENSFYTNLKMGAFSSHFYC
jgi:uncharacterized membrane protein